MKAAWFLTLLLWSSTGFGTGEWHSAGNDPIPPYYPQGPLRLECEVSSSRDGLLGDKPTTAKFTSRDFEEAYGAVTMEHAGFDVYISYLESGDGEELEVTISKEGLRTSARAPRAARKILNQVEVPSKDQTSVTITARCREET